MKKILITGANSYIGTSLERYLAQWPEEYQVDTVDMVDGTWRQKSFAGYDSVFHVAGIAHVKETKENAHLYGLINRDLAVETAKKAKQDGVKQFVFLSTMAVYGVQRGALTVNSVPNPVSNYGKAKFQAECLLEELRSDEFVVCVMRPPMVYGEGCKGNYQTLVKIAKLLPVFPDYKNTRSMIHIDRLSWYVKSAVDGCTDGLILPQDEAYVCTCEMVRDIARGMGKDLKLLKVLNPLVAVAKLLPIGRKAFEDLYYER